MSQGKAWNKDEVIKTLEPYFKLGCGVTKACNYAGIPRSTVQTWIDDDEELRLKVTAWQNEINTEARRVWRDEIMVERKFDAADKWLTKKEKDEFSGRTELTGAEGEALIPERIKEIDEALTKIL